MIIDRKIETMNQAGTLYKLNFPNGKSYIGITQRGFDARFKGVS